MKKNKLTNNPTGDPNEWIMFQKHARRFDGNPPEKRYGIYNPSSKLESEDDMLYAPDPLSLRKLFVRNWPTIKLKRHLDKLEVMEGKKPKGYSSLVKGIE